jgi:hypothetical protein
MISGLGSSEATGRVVFDSNRWDDNFEVASRPESASGGAAIAIAIRLARVVLLDRILERLGLRVLKQALQAKAPRTVAKRPIRSIRIGSIDRACLK